MKTEMLETMPTDVRSIHAGVILDQMLDVDNVPEHMFRSVEPGPDILLPTNYLGSESLVVPSLQIETPRGNHAKLVSLHESDPRLEKFYNDTVKAKNMGKRVDEMFYDSAVRILDTSGAEGLHHLHTAQRFPYTIYHQVRRGTGEITPSVYVTRLGVDKDNLPVLGRITATKDRKAARRLFNLLSS